MNDLSPQLQHGWTLFHSGDLIQAGLVARQITLADPQFAAAWFLQGLVHHVRGELLFALQSYEQALALGAARGADDTDVMNNLGVLYSALGRQADALALRQKIIALKPDDAIANCNLANSLAALGEGHEAERHFRVAIDRQPDFFDALANYGALLVNIHKSAEAIPILRRALALRFQSVDVHNNLGLALLNVSEFAPALQHLNEARRLEPRYSPALTNLGALHARLGEFDKALECFRQSLELRPDDAICLDGYANTLHELRRSDEAVTAYERAIALRPGLASIRVNYGKTLSEMCRWDDAVVQLREAIRLEPEHAEAHNVLGLVQFHQADDAGAAASFEEALRLDPGHQRARLNRSFLRLRKGEFAQAWPDYELRLVLREVRTLESPLPRWTGEDIAGKTLLVRFEQGLGDILQFLRYMPLAQARAKAGSKGGRVLVEIPASLIPLVSRTPGVDGFIEAGAQLPRADVQIPLLSLPYALGTVDAPEPHLFADPALVRSWGDRLRGETGFKVGIAWQGDAGFRYDRARSIPLAAFAPLAQVAGVRLVSLQKHAGAEQIAANAGRVPLVQFTDELDEPHGGKARAFADTAAIMKNLDLVVTSDSVIAHLAGGLGVPVWTAVQLGPEWRWQLGRDDSPWYPTMRLFRQTTNGDWSGVFERIALALKDAVLHRPAKSAPAAPPIRHAVHANTYLVPTSPGELLDKMSILQIKSERLTSPAQLDNVRTELRALEGQRDRLLAGHSAVGQDGIDDLIGKLREVNGVLWQIEEDIRQCEKEQRFDDRFIELARSVYKFNDQRAALKREINTRLGSAFMEEKTHPLPDAGPAANIDTL